MPWLVFSYSLPTKPSSSPRVTLWRRLKRIGVVALNGGLYLLPDRAESLESLQWLAQEVRAAGGDALVMRVERFEGLDDKELIERFHAARREDYAALARQLDTVVARLLEDASNTKSVALEELEKLRLRQSEIRRVDFFNSPEGVALARRLTQLGKRLTEIGAAEVRVESASVKAFIGQRWVTRPHPHVDRLACIWLIRRFIDAAAVIRYREAAQPGEVSFDMTAARFGHLGNLCSFETMIAAFGLSDPALQALAEIVHELDLRDGCYARPEAAGIDAVLDGWRQRGLTDEELERHGVVLFEGLYSSLHAALSLPQSGTKQAASVEEKAI